VYGRFLRAKTRVSELEVRYTVPEVKAGDGFVVIQTPFGKIIQIIRDDRAILSTSKDSGEGF
jgi:hypothetical protein